MNRDIFAKFYAISSLLAGIAGDYAEEFLMFDNEKMRGYSVSLVNEIDELLKQGKTKEEVVTIIKENDFVAKDPELTKDEGEYLRNYSLKILNIRYQLFVEKTDKHFTDVDDEEPESRKLIKP